MAEREKKGQALVLVALVLVALIALVGLAVDGGRLYALRRQVQNAADAAALAGARELATVISECRAGAAEDNVRVGQAVLNFARINGVDEDAANGDVEAWYVDKDTQFLGYVRFDAAIPNRSTGVSTRLVATDTTTFMHVLGIQYLTAVGEATAMVGPVIQYGGGLLPIAVPEIALKELLPGDQFYFFDSTGVFCRLHDDYCFLGTDNGGPAAQRGWLQLGHIYNPAFWNSSKPPNRVFIDNMSVAGCKPAPPAPPDPAKTGLAGWASGECPYPYLLYAGQKGTLSGDFIAGLAGTSNAALGEIATHYGPGDVVYAPVFDYVYGDNEMKAAFADCPPDNDPNAWMSGNSVYYYHIIGIVAVELSEVDKSAKYIEAAFKNAVIGEGQIAPGDGVGSGNCTVPLVLGVRLWD